MQAENSEEVSFKELVQKALQWFHYLKAKWVIIVCAGVVGGLSGVGYSMLKKPLYTASLTFALEEKSPGGAAGLSSIASSFGLNLGGGEGGAFAGDNIIELMKSRLLIEKTLFTKVEINGSTEILLNRYINSNNLREKWVPNSELSKVKFDTIQENTHMRAVDSLLGIIYLDFIRGNLLVAKIDKKLSIISVKVKSKDEVFAKLFCENLVKNVTDFYVETKVGKSRKNIQLLVGRVDSVRRELDQAMYGRANFADQNMGLIRQSANVPKLKQEMRVQMLGTMYGELVKNLEFSKLALMREEPLIQVIDRPVFPLEKTRLGKLKALIIGGFIGAFLSLAYLVLRVVIRNVLVQSKI